MTHAEIRLDAYRSGLFALAMLATDCDIARAIVLHERWKQEHGVCGE